MLRTGAQASHSSSCLPLTAAHPPQNSHQACQSPHPSHSSPAQSSLAPPSPPAPSAYPAQVARPTQAVRSVQRASFKLLASPERPPSCSREARQRPVTRRNTVFNANHAPTDLVRRAGPYKSRSPTSSPTSSPFLAPCPAPVPLLLPFVPFQFPFPSPFTIPCRAYRSTHATDCLPP